MKMDYSDPFFEASLVRGGTALWAVEGVIGLQAAALLHTENPPCQAMQGGKDQFDPRYAALTSSLASRS